MYNAPPSLVAEHLVMFKSVICAFEPAINITPPLREVQYLKLDWRIEASSPPIAIAPAAPNPPPSPS